MKKIVVLFAALSILSGVTAFAGPPKKAVKKPTTKLVEVWKCPITGETVSNKADKGVVVGKYKAHFCCAGCPEKFAKMSKKDKLSKMAELCKPAGKHKG